MSAKKLLIGLVIVALAGAGIAANIWWRETPTPEVQVEAASRRDLTATVSGSGAIRPAREVDISSNVMGRVTRLLVEEGDVVAAGDLLLEIDPQRLQSAVDQMQASLAAARTGVRLAEEDLKFAQQSLDRVEGLYRQDLASRDQYEQALQSVSRAERGLESRQADVERIEAQLAQTRYDLTQVRIDAPMNGIITKLNIDQGENVVTGTMNNAGTVLLTIADLSVLEAEIEVDETDIVSVEVGQPATVRIDAFPDRTFSAVVAEVAKSPIRGSAASAAAGNQAINFKVVVRLTDSVPGARPGLSATADIVTATRVNVLSVPIQALILREVKVDAEGQIIREEIDPMALDVLPPADAKTAEMEGAFVVRDGHALFLPIKVGVAGERHFEVLEGVEEDDRVITGPFEVIRTLVDGEPVKVAAAATKPTVG